MQYCDYKGYGGSFVYVKAFEYGDKYPELRHYTYKNNVDQSADIKVNINVRDVRLVAFDALCQPGTHQYED